MEKQKISQRVIQAVNSMPSLNMGKKGFITGTLETVALAALFIVIIVMVMVFGAGFIADEKDRVETKYGNDSTAFNIVESGETSLVRLSDGTVTIVGAIVLGLVIAVLFTVLMAGRWNNSR